MFETEISAIQGGQDLSADQMQQAIGKMLNGQASDQDIGDLLLALRAKRESVSELVGAARALRIAMTPIRTERQGLLDTCGTGGDGAKTFNISTASALVAAAAGVPVAKHGNRKITSATGSADVLSQLGIRVDAPRESVEHCLDTLGICFCFAPLLHPAMKHVAEVRRSLGVPTLFNLLGPLCNPAGASYQVLGVGRADSQQKIAAALSHLPIRRAVVVRGLDGLDEVSLSADTEVIEITGGEMLLHHWTPGTFGLSEIDSKSLQVNGPEESAHLIRQVLEGQPGGPRDVVLANAATGVWVAGLTTDLKDAVAKCASAIDSGKAKQLLHNLGLLTTSNISSKR